MITLITKCRFVLDILERVQKNVILKENCKNDLKNHKNILTVPKMN